MLAKRKRVVLSLKMKCEIMNRLEHGEIMTKLTDEYVIGQVNYLLYKPEKN